MRKPKRTGMEKRKWMKEREKHACIEHLICSKLRGRNHIKLSSCTYSNTERHISLSPFYTLRGGRENCADGHSRCLNKYTRERRKLFKTVSEYSSWVKLYLSFYITVPAILRGWIMLREIQLCLGKSPIFFWMNYVIHQNWNLTAYNVDYILGIMSNPAETGLWEFWLAVVSWTCL